MKIAIYGVSGSGKDYLIGQLVDYLAERGVTLAHALGSTTLNRQAESLHGSKFSELPEQEKANLRAAFTSSLVAREEEAGNVAVDGHFAFMNAHGDIYEVFTEADLRVYDAFFYLDTSSYEISRRLREERAKEASPESISRLKEYEICGLTERLLEAGKELHVIKNDGKPTLRYIHEVMLGMHDSAAIARSLVAKLEGLEGHGVVALVDCDKTLVKEDTTSMLLGVLGLDTGFLQSNYALDRYSNYQDFMARTWLEGNAPVDEPAISAVCDAATPNANLVADLADSPDVPIVAISAGNESIWNRLLGKLELKAQLLCPTEGMSKYVKYFVVKDLQKAGKYVVAFGDSLLDGFMLRQADRGYIVAAKGYRSNVAKLLASNAGIRQLRYSAHQYEGTPSDPCACWVKCLDNTVHSIRSDISLCRSSSGTSGAKLRQAHHRLGMEVGAAIAQDHKEERFAVIVMMRSGLPFGQGIADHLDCPELFFAGDIERLKGEIAEYGLQDRTLILADGVINTGASIRELITELDKSRLIVSANVVASSCPPLRGVPVYAARVSDNSYVGARQWELADGKGPDTSDRLFATL